MDLTDNIELQETKIVLECSVRLDKKTMLNALLSDAICINGEYYKVPGDTLLECLINRKYGETILRLEKIESKMPITINGIKYSSKDIEGSTE